MPVRQCSPVRTTGRNRRRAGASTAWRKQWMVVATSSTKASSSRTSAASTTRHHGVVLAPDHAVVAGGVGQHRGEQRRRRPGGAMVAHQRGQRGGAHQRRVAGEHHDVAVGVDEPVGEGGEPDGEGVAGPELRGLLDELDGERARGVVDEGLGHPVTPVSHHHDDLVHGKLGQRVEDVEDHGAAAQPVQGLGARRAHPCPLAGGEDDGRERPHLHAV